jgi:hypothetical protein
VKAHDLFIYASPAGDFPADFPDSPHQKFSHNALYDVTGKRVDLVLTLTIYMHRLIGTKNWTAGIYFTAVCAGQNQACEPELHQHEDCQSGCVI